MKKYKIAFWIATVIIFLFEGIMSLFTLLFASEYVTVGTRALGYPDYFAFALIIFKVVGAVALIIPQIPGRIKEWAYAGFAFDFIFACISHLAVDGAEGQSFFPLLVLAVLAVSYVSYHKLHPAVDNRL